MNTIVSPCPCEAFKTLEIAGDVGRPYVACEATTAKVTTGPPSRGKRLGHLLSFDNTTFEEFFSTQPEAHPQQDFIVDYTR